ncbi:hypothetical protein ASD42_31755 [Nocardia sp. Root136]|nr:hypothetical protein ASD42_31755 [Nocardia sp. Root136]
MAGMNTDAAVFIADKRLVAGSPTKVTSISDQLVMHSTRRRTSADSLGVAAFQDGYVLSELN